MKSVVRFILRVFFIILFRVEIVNKHNVPKSGAALLCANHNAELGMFFIGYKLKRLVRWMAKEELFKYPVFSSFIKWAGAFPVKRGKGDIGSVKTVLRLLKEGHIVGMFPEGTRVRKKDDNSFNAKAGVAMFAVQTGAPILPVGVEGGNKIFGKVKIVFGEPYHLDIEAGKKYNNEELTELSNGIMRKVYGLLEVK
jgi:1-acyl-sn-glycerol-3-phosphate acyltransferase